MRSPTPLLYWVLVAPLLLGWSLGTSYPLLDLASLPAAYALSLPAQGAWWGAAGALLLCGLATALGPRVRALWLVGCSLGTLGATAVLASSLSQSRPLLWLVILPLALGPKQEPDRSAWLLPQRALPVLGGLCWLLAVQITPWGSQPLLAALDGVAGPLVDGLPGWGGTGLGVVTLAVSAALLAWRVRPRPVAAALGALAGVALELSFGGLHGVLLAALAGGLVGAWALPLREASQRPLLLLLPLLLLSTVLAGSAAWQERWSCASSTNASVRFISTERDVEDIAVIPGNLPFIVLLRDDGRRIDRLGPTGQINGSAALDPPGGFLLSSGRSRSPFARVVGTDEATTIEWWSPSSLKRTHALELPGQCSPVDGRLVGENDRVYFSCRHRREILFGEPGGQEIEILGTPKAGREPLSGRVVPVVFARGPRARFWVENTSAPEIPGLGPYQAGPWASTALVTPDGLLVAGGPSGRLEVRALDPLDSALNPRPEETSQERSARAFDHVVERASLGVWAEDLVWNDHQSAVYVTSAHDGRIVLVDPEVTWHRKTVSVGAPPSRVVVDPQSGSLFGVNRCGLFELRIPSLFPWESTGDVEVETTPTPTVAPEEAP